MKKVLIIMLVLTCLLGLVGCDPAVNNLSKGKLLADTVKIELWDYKNENPELVRLNGRKKPRFNFDNATLIATLDESRFEDILSDMAECEYLDFGTALNEPLGKTLVLYQKNGNIMVLFGCVYQNKYYYGDCYVFDKKGLFVEYVGDVGHVFMDEIVSEYFQAETELRLSSFEMH